MITAMHTYEILIWVALAHYLDSMPSWLNTIILATWFVAHFIACVSESNLRDKVDKLEEELKKHTSADKGGEG